MMLNRLQLLLVVLLLGCTLTSDFDVHQCNAHADCDSLSGDIARCEAHRCIPGCADNLHCASIDPRSPLCQRNDRACVGLTSAKDRCFAAAGYEPAWMSEFAVEDLLVLGTFAPTLRTPAWLGAQLAVEEINGRGGIPVHGTSKPVVLVLCDASTRAAQEESIDHLVGTLHAGAIVASFDDDAVRAALERPSTRDAALYLSPNGFDPWNIAASSETHAWYLGEDYSTPVSAYAPVLQRVVASLVARGKDPNLVRIASLVGATREDDDIATAVARTVVLGGKDFTRLENEGRYLTIHLDDSQSQADTIADYAPDIVLLFAGGLAAGTPHRSRAGVIEDLESRSVNGGWSPLYVLGSRSVREPFVALFAAANPAFRSRAIGVTAEPSPNATASAGLIARYATTFPVAPPAEMQFGVAPQTYDAVYYAALAIAAAPAGPTGAMAVAAGLEQITQADAEAVAIGPDGLARVAELLAQGVPFNLIASTGEASFDPGSFSRSGAPRVVCWLSNGSVADRGVPASDPAAPIEILPLDCAQEVFDAI